MFHIFCLWNLVVIWQRLYLLNRSYFLLTPEKQKVSFSNRFFTTLKLERERESERESEREKREKRERPNSFIDLIHNV